MLVVYRSRGAQEGTTEVAAGSELVNKGIPVGGHVDLSIGLQEWWL